MYECKLCGGNAEAHTETEQVRYRGAMLSVPLAYCVCANCNEEFVPTELVRENDATFRAAKRHYDGLLAPEEIRSARLALGLTQEEASRVFGGGANAFSKYERGEVTQSVSMDRLIRLCRHHPELLEDLRSDFLRIADLQPVRSVFTAGSSEWDAERTEMLFTSQLITGQNMGGVVSIVDEHSYEH